MLATPTLFGGGLTAVAKTHKTVSSESAANSLRHLRRLGFEGINPQDVEQQKAYIALRATQPRCTAKQFLDYFKSLQNVTTHGAGAKQVLWAVPKGNFPDGLPAHIERCRKDEANCEGFIVDHDNYWVVDQCITQPELGVDVFPIDKFLSTNITGSFTAAGSATGHALEVAAPSSPLQLKRPATGGVERTTKRQRSDAGDAVEVPLAIGGVERPALGGNVRVVKRHESDANAQTSWGSGSPSSSLTADQRRARAQS